MMARFSIPNIRRAFELAVWMNAFATMTSLANPFSHLAAGFDSPPLHLRHSHPIPSPSRSRCLPYPGAPLRTGAAPAARAEAQLG